MWAQWPAYPHRSYGYYPKPPVPGYQRPDSFWSEKPQTCECNWDEESAQQEAQRKQSEEIRKAAKRKKRKKQLATELPEKLSVTLHTILQLDAAIHASEKEREEANETIETKSVEDGEPFWDAVFERNVKLNALRKERDNAMHEYRKFYRVLKKIDPKRGEEARKIYKALRKETSGAEEAVQPDLSDAGVEVEEATRNHSDQRDHHVNNHSSHPTEHQQKSKSFCSSPALDMDQAPDEQEEVFDSQTHVHDPNINSEPNEEEIIFIAARKLHAAHDRVQSEFWSIADGDNVCTYCGKICAVLQCPLWDECGLYACEHCKNSR